MNYPQAKRIADGLVAELAPACDRIEIAGGVRRKKDNPHDIEIVCIPSPGAPRASFGDKVVYKSYLEKSLAVLEAERILPHREKNGDKFKKYHINTDHFGCKSFVPFALDLFIVTPETWGVLFTIRTGPSDFSRLCVTPRALGGYLPDGYKVKDGRVWVCENWHSDDILTVSVDMPEEQAFLDFLGLGWIEPEKRNGAFKPEYMR
jgi:DNA polymerase/3'-5' exonuclease PolX